MTTTKTILSVWIGNLADYNAGLLNGQWYNLDDYTEDELRAAVKELTNGGNDEYFIADYESDYGIEVDEYDGIMSIYQQYNIINDVVDKYGDEADDIIEAYTTMISDDLRDIDRHEFIIYYNCDSMAEVAERFLEETGGLSEIPDHLRNYFDFEQYGRDMSFEGCYCFTDNGNCVEIIR